MQLSNSVSRTVFACYALVFLSACAAESNPLLKTTAGKLAAIDAGTTSITENDVRPYNVLLTKLAAKCADTPAGISDTAVTARNIFKSSKGRVVSALSVMRMIDDATPEGTNSNCDEVIAAIITLS